MAKHYTENAKDVMAEAIPIATKMAMNFVGTEHLLLAIVESNGIGAEILRRAGISAVDIKTSINEILGRS